MDVQKTKKSHTKYDADFKDWASRSDTENVEFR